MKSLMKSLQCTIVAVAATMLSAGVATATPDIRYPVDRVITNNVFSTVAIGPTRFQVENYFTVISEGTLPAHLTHVPGPGLLTMVYDTSLGAYPGNIVSNGFTRNVPSGDSFDATVTVTDFFANGDGTWTEKGFVTPIGGTGSLAGMGGHVPYASIITYSNFEGTAGTSRSTFINGYYSLPVTESSAPPGASQENPILPNDEQRLDGGGFRIVASSGVWVDPPTANGYRYTMLSDAVTFDGITLPTGFGNMTVSTDACGTLGSFQGGAHVAFCAADSREVAVTDIVPTFDSEDLTAFPVKLAFRNGDVAEFTAVPIPVPEPGTWAMIGLGLAVLAFGVRERRGARSMAHAV